MHHFAMRRFVGARGRLILLALAGSTALAGCALNPVTGRRELHMVSEATEIQLGQKYYAPSRQSQGGDYVTDPKVTAYVKQVGGKLAGVADRKLPYEFVVLNASEVNAWALPGGKIAINRGLLTELSSEAELAAVLGHEIVHAAARHSAQQMEKGQLMQIGSAVAAVAAGAYGGAELGRAVGQGAQIGSQMLQAKYGRDDELEADKYGMKYMKLTGYDLAAAVSLQELFVRKFSARSQDWMSGLFASHPPSQARVDANRVTMAELGGPGGELGVDRYKTALAGLKRSAPAYAKFDQAIDAAKKKDLPGARSLAEQAVKLEPRESRFYDLLADIALASENPRAALGYAEQARSRDPGYFKPLLQAGVAHFELGNRAAAEPLLEKSMELMPTGPGAYYLGRVYEDGGNRSEAVEMYRMVAGSKSALGREAMGRLSRLDGGQSLAQALVIEAKLDRDGRVWLAVGNRSSQSVSNVSVLVGVVNRSGRTVQGPSRVGTGYDVIPPGRAVNVATSLGPFESADALRYVKWKVERVELAQ